MIVIGRGPAGISAALYTVRANLKTLVIGTDTSSLKNASKIENYYGFENPVSGKLLLDNGVRQASRLGATIIDQEVTSIEPGNLFIVKTATRRIPLRSSLIRNGPSTAPTRTAGNQRVRG